MLIHEVQWLRTLRVLSSSSALRILLKTSLYTTAQSPSSHQSLRRCENGATHPTSFPASRTSTRRVTGPREVGQVSAVLGSVYFLRARSSLSSRRSATLRSLRPDNGEYTYMHPGELSRANCHTEPLILTAPCSPSSSFLLFATFAAAQKPPILTHIHHIDVRTRRESFVVDVDRSVCLDILFFASELTSQRADGAVSTHMAGWPHQLAQPVSGDWPTELCQPHAHGNMRRGEFGMDDVRNPLCGPVQPRRSKRV